MRIGFYFNADHLESFSIEAFEQGLLGLSGTDSSFFRVVKGLSAKNGIEVFLFATNIQSFSGVIFEKVAGIDEAITQGNEAGIDVLIFNDLKNADKTKKTLHLAESLGVKLVIWAQNPVLTLDEYAQSAAVLKIVYVESFDLNQIRHKNAFYKGVVIPNGIEKEPYTKKPIAVPSNLNVLYLGSLTPGKGFHHLAKAWPEVLKKVPDATLSVIGSGKLYNNHAKLGPLGLADAEYEKELVPYIGSNTEELQQNNIICYGLLNRNEIIDLIHNCKVACINPNTWGSLESCSVSSLEIQLSGVPVVAGKAGGNLNTIIHNKTGILIKNHKSELPAAIVQLLTDNALNLRMRTAARQFILEKYEIDKVIDTWVNFLTRLKQGHAFPLPEITPELAEVKLYIKEAMRIANKVVGREIY